VNRIIALDYGNRRIGIAISDPLQMIALPLETLEHKNLVSTVQRLAGLIRDYHVEKIVLGFPLSLRGGKTAYTRKVEQFGKLIEANLGLPIIYWDERLSSVQAQRAMIAMNEKPSRNKAKIDKLSAVLILQNYLESQSKIHDCKKEEMD
jgi:putative Holliday junction resolvase